MTCTFIDEEYQAYITGFRQKAAQLRIPVSGSVDVTSRCNLDCVHCYLGKGRTGTQKELSTEQWIRIIDEMTEAGCLFLLITGGEPLLKRGFDKIYAHAKNNGLIVTVFTNGTLINTNTVKLFKELPPQAVEVSLYGASKDVYESITGKPGSYEKCLAGIAALHANNIRVKLKTVLMTKNTDEFYAIERLAAELDVPFRLDAALFPCLDHNRAPLDLRVPPEDAVAKELSDPVRLAQWQDYYEKGRHNTLWTGNDPLYRCLAGITSFHVDSYGKLKPCLMTDHINVDLSRSSFLEGWKEVIPKIKDRSAGNGFQCAGCEKIIFCGYCPAFFELETGREDRHSDYLCKTAQLRYEAVVHSIESSAFSLSA